MNREVSHYVVTAHPPGGVLHTVKCNFLAKDSEDVIIGKSRRLEVRQLRKSLKEDGINEKEDEMMGTTGHNSTSSNASPFPIVLSAPINGRITSLQAFQLDSKPTSLLFLTTDQYQYAVIGYNPNIQPHCIQTYASGSLKDEWNMLGSLSECGPIVTIDPHSRCIVLHLYDGLVTIFPIMNGHYTNNNNNMMLGPVFHARLEERTILAMTMLYHFDSMLMPPHLCLLHQDSRGAQHITTHVIDLKKSQLLSQASVIAGQGQQQGQTNQSSSNAAITLNTCEWLKKSRLDGGSSLLIPIPPRRPVAAAASASATTTATTAGSNQSNTPTSQCGGVVVLGQRQITFCALNHYKVMPIPPALILCWDALPPDVSGMPRFLLGDEFGNLHMLTLITQDVKVVALQLDTLGSCTLSSCLQYLNHGLVFCGSTMGDSQLVQIHDEPIPVDEEDMDDGDAALELGDTTYLSVVEEYTHLGPIVDFDLVPMAGNSASSSGQTGVATTSSTAPIGQSQVVTASGTSKSGSIRVIRNGIGMKEYASVELSGIQNMWSLRKKYDDTEDAYLVQSFVGETRVLGVVSTGQKAQGEDMMDVDNEKPAGADSDERMETDQQEESSEVGGTLEEVYLCGLESNASTLYVCNVVGNLFLQVTGSQIRLSSMDGNILDTFVSETNMTVASCNETGQVVVSLQGGKLLYFQVEDAKLVQRSSKQMDREVSCLNVNPFRSSKVSANFTSSGDVKQSTNTKNRSTHIATMCAVGLWDDFTVRLLSLESTDLLEVLQIHLSTDDDEGEPLEGSMQGQRRNRNNMMARSLCMITLDFSSSGTSSSTPLTSSMSTPTSSNVPGVDMLLVGLGDGTLVSFAVVHAERIQVRSKKEVSLGTQRVNLIPLNNERGGSCVLATGDRPTVIYLAGMGGTSGKANYNPKLCYSNVNLSPVDEGDGSDISRPHTQEAVAVNVAAPFFSPLLFDDMSNEHYSLCIADDANLRLGVIDDIQKLHVTTCKLGMAPRRIIHCAEGNLFAVGCIESGVKELGVDGGDMSMGNCIRFLDDSTFVDIHRIDLEPREMILSMLSASLSIYRPTPTSTSVNGEIDSGIDPEQKVKAYLVVGTAYVLHDEDEPTKGRILVYSYNLEDGPAGDGSNRSIKLVTELQVRGGVYSMCQFYDGRILVTVNSKTHVCQIVNDGTGVVKMNMVGVGHHGHILSLFVSSRAPKQLPCPSKTTADPSESDGTPDQDKKPASKTHREMLAIVGDLMRSISLVQYYPQHHTLEEVARDFNANWTTALAMLTDDVYLGGENWNNLFVLRRNVKAQSEEVRCRLDTVGEFHLGEMCNKFMSGSLVMPSSSSDTTMAGGSQTRRRSITSPAKKSSKASPKGSASPGGGPPAATRSKKPVVRIGSQTLFGTVDGTLGVILGLDSSIAAFFSCLEKSMEQVIMPIGNFSHEQFRAFNAEQRLHPCHGFVDGDLVESFLDLDKSTMELVVQQMNKDGSWDINSSAFRGKEDKTTDMSVDLDEGVRLELSVDDVLAVVEEMAMLH